MAIFGNKKKSDIERLDELLAEIDRLPEDEQEKVWAHFDEEKDRPSSYDPGTTVYQLVEQLKQFLE